MRKSVIVYSQSTRVGYRFVLRHYNDDFMHSYGGLPQVQLLKHASNLETFALLVDQADPDVLAKATGFPHEVAIIEPTLRAYQKATAALDDRNIDDFVRELVVKGPFNEAGRLKFLREHIKAIGDEVLGRFQPALIKKLDPVGKKAKEQSVLTKIRMEVG